MRCICVPRHNRTGRVGAEGPFNYPSYHLRSSVIPVGHVPCPSFVSFLHPPPSISGWVSAPCTLYLPCSYSCLLLYHLRYPPSPSASSRQLPRLPFYPSSSCSFYSAPIPSLPSPPTSLLEGLADPLQAFLLLRPGHPESKNTGLESELIICCRQQSLLSASHSLSPPLYASSAYLRH